MDVEKEKQKFRNHVATLADYGNIKIIDFKNPNSDVYQIRFIFEEDYCKLHISGDMGEMIATNRYNMTYEKFSDFVNNTRYFEDKIDCMSRGLYYWNEDKALKQIEEMLKEYGYNPTEMEDEIEEILLDFEDGLSLDGKKKLTEFVSISYEDAEKIGRYMTSILDLYMLAFKLAVERLNEDTDM